MPEDKLPRSGSWLSRGVVVDRGLATRTLHTLRVNIAIAMLLLRPTRQNQTVPGKASTVNASGATSVKPASRTVTTPGLSA